MKVRLTQHFDGGKGAISCDNPCCKKGLIATGWYPQVKYYYNTNYKIIIRKTVSRYLGYCSVKCLLQHKYGKRLINKIVCDSIK